MLKNLQNIMEGDFTHAAVRLWHEELSEAEAAAIHNRMQGDPEYRGALDGLLTAVDAMEPLERDPDVEAIAHDYPRLLRERRMRRRLALGMAAGVLVAIGAALSFFAPWGAPDDSPLEKYYTGIGEQRTIELADGSVITLNTGGRLLVDYGAQARRVLLERGEAYFEVAEDRARPFTVDLGLRSVTALGTAFNVRKDRERFQVAVTEGAVAFHEAAEGVSRALPPVSVRGSGPLRVEAGWVAEFDVSRNELTAFQPESMDRYLDWRSGVLSFYDEPLFLVVRELNRYSRRKILIEDASIMELGVYTIIRVKDIETALPGLEQVLPIEVRRHYDRIVITASADSGDRQFQPTGE